MADFAAILTKTLNKMGETTPGMRAQVYDKARQTVQRQIDAMATRPPQAAIDRQFAKLEEAIAEIEAGYDHAPAPEPDVEVDDQVDAEVPPVPEGEPDATPEAEAEPEHETPPDPDEPDAPFVSIEPGGEAQTDEALLPESEPVAGVDPEAPTRIADEDGSKAADPTVDDVLASLDQHADRAAPPDLETTGAEGEQEPLGREASVLPDAKSDDPLLDFLNEQRDALLDADAIENGQADRAADALFGEAGETVGAPGSTTAGAEAGDLDADQAPTASDNEVEDVRRPRWRRLAVLVIILGLIGAGGYAAYVNQEPIRAFLADYGIELPETGRDSAGVATDADDVPVRTVETTPVSEPTETDAPAAGTPPAEEPAAATPPETVNAAGGDAEVEKFTQRLTEDGREIDEGPADGAAGTGEGSTIAGQTVPSDATAPDAGATSPETGESEAPGVAVGQRTIFYEERTGSQPGTALQGSTVWSVVQESPGGDLPVEPAIRAQSAIPELDLTLELTIRRNGDATFPASHIVELFFRVPDTFEGRGIADVQRITFKNTEQDPGSALIAVPAPIDTNIFLVALTDAETAVQTNTSLMLSQGWVDIPMQYVSGRRALITLEKGASGDAVFREVFDAWAASPLGEAGGG